MFPYLPNITLSTSATIAAAMDTITRNIDHTGGNGLALVCDDGILKGVLTEGDIRRHLLRGGRLMDRVTAAMTADPHTVGVGHDPHLTLRRFEKGVRHLPVVDGRGRLVDLILYREFGGIAEPRNSVIRSRAPLRISFAGGGTDLTPIIEAHGGAVISATITRYCHVTLIPRFDDAIVIESLDLNMTERFPSLAAVQYGGGLDLIKACIRVCRPDFGFVLRTASDEPPGSGLGSSSAMAVAVIGALISARTGHVDEYRVAEAAFQAERIELGMDGGWQDQYAAAFGGLNHIEFDRDGTVVQSLRIKERVRLELESNLLLVFSGECRHATAVHAANDGGAETAQDPRSRYAGMSGLVRQVRRAILKGDLDGFGRLLDQAWSAKKGIHNDVSNSAVDTAYALAKRHGAMGAKLLGAGKGGYLLLYVAGSDRFPIQRALRDAGYRVRSLTFDWKGLQVWRNPARPEGGR